MLGRFLRNEDGQGMVEYVLIIASIAIFVFVALSTVSGTLKQEYENVKNEVVNALP